MLTNIDPDSLTAMAKQLAVVIHEGGVGYGYPLRMIPLDAIAEQHAA